MLIQAFLKRGGEGQWPQRKVTMAPWNKAGWCLQGLAKGQELWDDRRAQLWEFSKAREIFLQRDSSNHDPLAVAWCTQIWIYVLQNCKGIKLHSFVWIYKSSKEWIQKFRLSRHSPGKPKLLGQRDGEMETIACYTTRDITSNLILSVFPVTSHYKAQIIDFLWLPYHLLGIYIFPMRVFLIFILFLQNHVALTSCISMSTCVLCLRIQSQIFLLLTPYSGSVYWTSVDYLVTEVDKNHFLSWGTYFQIVSDTWLSKEQNRFLTKLWCV